VAKKSDLKKRLNELAKPYDAEVSESGDGFVLSKPGERETLLVTQDTDEHLIDRYLRGAAA
jgi:hypothetical protein